MKLTVRIPLRGPASFMLLYSLFNFNLMYDLHD